MKVATQVFGLGRGLIAQLDLDEGIERIADTLEPQRLRYMHRRRLLHELAQRIFRRALRERGEISLDALVQLKDSLLGRCPIVLQRLQVELRQHWQRSRCAGPDRGLALLVVVAHGVL
ncbi:MAG: hypothetical protein ABI867_40005 [Kofleriaceae bacterium]